jgi:hypothetical protein
VGQELGPKAIDLAGRLRAADRERHDREDEPRGDARPAGAGRPPVHGASGSAQRTWPTLQEHQEIPYFSSL